MSKVFVEPLPFNLDFVDHKYFIVDAIFRFQLKPLRHKEFDTTYSFIRDRTLFFHFHNQDSAIATTGGHWSGGRNNLWADYKMV